MYILIMAYYGNPKIRNCIFNGNQAIHSGGALRFYDTENTTVQNCVFYNNSLVATFPSQAIEPSGTASFHGNGFEFNFINCIFWESGDSPFPHTNQNYSVNITYSLTHIYGEGFTSGPVSYGEGCDLEDPIFIDYNEFRIGSNSPAIDAGNPSPEYNDFDGSRNDIGAYGGSKGNW